MKVIHLKTEETEEGKVEYFIQELPVESLNTIISKKGTLKDNPITIDGVHTPDILLYGGVSQLGTGGVSKYIGTFQSANVSGQPINGRHLDKETHYRDYGRSEERQKSTAHLVNICPDVRMSIKSLQRALNCKYCMIWMKKS